jgi:hypothetical protein
MAKPTSFENDIRPFFTEQDIRAMSKAINRGNYEDVKAYAVIIHDRIRGIGGAVMPPPPPRGNQKWIDDGCQPQSISATLISGTGA